MTKAEAAEYMGISERSLERYTKDNRIGVRYEKGKTKPVPAYDQSELDRFKSELEKPVHKPAVQKMAPDFDKGDSLLAETGGNSLARPEILMQIIDATARSVGREVAQEFTKTLVEFSSLAPETDKSDTKRQRASHVPLGERKFLSVEESALYLGVSQGTITRAIKADILAVHRDLARGRRIKRADLDAWADAL